MSAKKRKSLEMWIEEIVECETYQSFLDKLGQIRKEICIDNDTLTLILFQYVWKDVSSETRFRVMMDYVSNQPFSFAAPYWFVYSLCSIYDADKVYDAFEYKVTSPQNNKRRKKMLAAFVSDLKNGLLDFVTQTGYNSRLDYYYICKRECGTRSENQNDYHMQHRIIRYFKTFEEFVLAMNGDLTDCNLRNAPITQEDLKLCYVDKTTKLPLSFYETKKQIEKYYDPIEEIFVVSTKILDAEGNVLEVEDKRSFETFQDFFSYLNGDLTNANLMFYEELDDIVSFPEVKLTGAKLSSDRKRQTIRPE